MFLLIRAFRKLRKAQKSRFTFHNVSINTSTDYEVILCTNKFTFHNVSINTRFHFSTLRCTCYLHSTMFLLIQGCKYLTPFENEFTFHNVSINTMPLDSLKTKYPYLHSTMFLLIQSAEKLAKLLKKLIYIPQCFY